MSEIYAWDQYTIGLKFKKEVLDSYEIFMSYEDSVEYVNSWVDSGQWIQNKENMHSFEWDVYSFGTFSILRRFWENGVSFCFSKDIKAIN